MKGRVSGLHRGEVCGGVVGDEFNVGGGVGHCLEETRFIIETDTVFVASAWDGSHIVDCDVG